MKSVQDVETSDRLSQQEWSLLINISNWISTYNTVTTICLNIFNRHRAKLEKIIGSSNILQNVSIIPTAISVFIYIRAFFREINFPCASSTLICKENKQGKSILEVQTNNFE